MLVTLFVMTSIHALLIWIHSHLVVHTANMSLGVKKLFSCRIQQTIIGIKLNAFVGLYICS